MNYNKEFVYLTFKLIELEIWTPHINPQLTILVTPCIFIRIIPAEPEEKPNTPLGDRYLVDQFFLI
jgi:hypothetical protein